MSKYEPLWIWLQNNADTELELSFDEIEEILGFPIDHSFLTYKKEAAGYGYEVGKISIKAQTVQIHQCD